jgi:hypothetical protein
MVKKLVLLEPDLLFSSRIESAAARAGWQVKVVVRDDELQCALHESAPDVLFVDLDALKSVGVSSSGSASARCRRVGYYSHVDSKLAARALAEGFEMVIPRRTFMDQMNKMLVELESS